MNKIINNLKAKVNSLNIFYAKNYRITCTVGKKPILKSWNNRKRLELSVLLEHINNIRITDANLGWILQPHDLVIDIDKKHGGFKSFEKLLKLTNLQKEDLPPTVITQGGGLHIYLAISDDVKHITKNLKGLEGIDFLSKGCCCAMVNNTIGDKSYKWADQCDQAGFIHRNAPKSLLDMIVSTPREVDIKLNEGGAKKNNAKKVPMEKLSIPTLIVEKYLNNIKCDTYDHWLKIGFALYDWHPIKGFKLWDNWAKSSDTYNLKELEDKWRSFDNKYDGKKITIRSLIKEGAAIEEVESISQHKIMMQKCSEYYYLQYSDKFLDSNHSIISRGALEVSIKKYLPKKRGYKGACDFVEKNHEVMQMIHREGVFDKHELIISHNGMNYLNTHFIKMHKIKSNMPEISTEIHKNDLKDLIYLETYLKILFEGDNLKIFASWITMAREGLVGWSPLIQGVEGIGKSKLIFVLKACLGEQNVSEITAGSVESEFTAWAGRAQLVNFFDEAKSSEMGWKRLKPFITNKTVEVIRKGHDPVDVTNMTSYFLTTNHLDAIPFTKTERRLWVVVSRFKTKKQSMDFVKAQPEIPTNITSNKFYARVSTILEKRQDLVRAYIYNLNCGKYKNIRQAPINDSFYKMYYASLGDPRGFLETKSRIETGGKFYYQDIVSQEDVFEHRNIGEMAQIKTLKKLGLTKLDEDIVIDGLSKTFWINENIVNPDEIEVIMTKHSATMNQWGEKEVSDLEVAKNLLLVPAKYHHKGVLLGLPFFEALELNLSNPQKSKLLKDLGYILLGRIRIPSFEKQTRIYTNKDQSFDDARDIICDHIQRYNQTKLLQN